MQEEIAGIRIPDSRLVLEAVGLAREASLPLVFNHAMRSYYFAELVAQVRKIKCDRELVCIGAVLHDLGLTERFSGPERFEVDGANAARDFLNRHGVAKDRTQLVWDAIALHSSVGLAAHKEPEVAVVHFGISVDVVGFGIEAVPPDSLAEVVKAYPRRGFKRDFQAILAQVAARKPHTAFGNFLADVGRSHVHGFRCPNFCDLLAGTPFSE